MIHEQSKVIAQNGEILVSYWLVKFANKFKGVTIVNNDENQVRAHKKICSVMKLSQVTLARNDESLSQAHKILICEIVVSIFPFEKGKWIG